MTQSPANATSSDSLRVLFIGNSYIYFNNMPHMLTEVAASKGKQVYWEMIVKGGARLRQHAANEQVIDRIKNGNWDYVVLQEQSLVGGRIVDGRLSHVHRKSFNEATAALHKMISDAGAQTLLHLTWARAHTPTILQDLAEIYYTAGETLNVPVAPVGKAWAKAKEALPHLNLYQPDDSHPSPAGSYVSAITLFGVLFQESPENAVHSIIGNPVEKGRIILNKTETLVDLNAADAAQLQAIAWTVINEKD